jgi:hypothetical protein
MTHDDIAVTTVYRVDLRAVSSVARTGDIGHDGLMYDPLRAHRGTVDAAKMSETLVERRGPNRESFTGDTRS